MSRETRQLNEKELRPGFVVERVWSDSRLVSIFFFQDIISNLRRMFDHDKIIIQSGLHCDFILSQRLGAIRFKWSDFNLTTNKDMIYEKFVKACSYYTQVFVLLQDDREANSAKWVSVSSETLGLLVLNPSYLLRTRSKHFDTLLSYLTRVTTVLISKHKSGFFFSSHSQWNPYQFVLYEKLIVICMSSWRNREAAEST